MSDQTVKADAGKLELALVPTEIIRDIAAVRQFGVKKYKDPDNWKKVEKQRYINAAYRHWLAYLDDPGGVDEESGLPHLHHCVCNLAFICEMERAGSKMEQVKTPIHVTPDLEPEKEPALKKPYRRIDRGKVKALRAAGWEIKKIADEMQCSDQSVRNILNDKE